MNSVDIKYLRAHIKVAKVGLEIDYHRLVMEHDKVVHTDVNFGKSINMLDEAIEALEVVMGCLEAEVE